MGASRLKTALAHSRQQAGSFIYQNRLALSVDELLIARAVCYRDYLTNYPEGWDGDEVENFWVVVNEAGLVVHERGVSLPGEKDPGLTEWDRPMFSNELYRRGRVYVSSALWSCQGRHPTHFYGKTTDPPLSLIISRISPRSRAWWIGAMRDGDANEDMITRAAKSDYCRWPADRGVQFATWAEGLADT